MVIEAEKLTVNIKVAARMMGFGENQVRAWVHCGKIKSIGFKQKHIRIEEVHDFLKRLEKEQNEKDTSINSV